MLSPNNSSCLATLLFGLGLAFTAPANATAAATEANGPTCAQKQFDLNQAAACIAAHLAEQLEQYANKYIVKRYRIAVYQFSEEDIPIDQQTADLLTNAVTSALQKRLSWRYAIVPRHDLTKLLDDARQLGADSLETSIATISSAGTIDLLIVGDLHRSRKNILASFKVHKVAGDIETIASTPPVSIQNLLGTISNTETLKSFIDRAAEHLRDAANDATLIELDGIGFENTQLSTKVSEYLEEELVEALGKKFRSVISGRSLNFARASLDRPDGSATGRYLMSGKYWLRPDAIKVRVSLQNELGHSHHISGLVSLEDLPTEGLRPTGTFGPIAENKLGPQGLRLASSKGKHPVYRVGEEFSFDVYIERDSYLFCYYLQADQKIIRIFPNAHYPSAKVAGKKRHRIPGGLLPFILPITPPEGVELLKCYATARDITDELPEQIRRNSFEPIPKEFIERLNQAFRGIPETGLTESSLAITVRGKI